VAVTCFGYRVAIIRLFMSELYKFIIVESSAYVHYHMKVRVIKVTGSNYARWWTP